MKNLFSAVKLMVLLASITTAQTAYYVDASKPNDDGDGLGWATAKKTIQSGLDIANSGDVIYVAQGTYDEAININKRVSLIGAGSGASGTILQSSNPPVVTGVTYGSGYKPYVEISASGVSGGPVLLKDLLIQTRQDILGEAYPLTGILFDPAATISYVELDNVRIIGTTSNNAVERGITVDAGTTLNNIAVKNCEFSNMAYGIIIYNNDISPTTAQNIDISNSTFHNNSIKGFYTERLSNSSFSNLTVTNNGNPDRSPPWADNNNAGIDINLSFGTYSNLTFNNLTITNNGIGSLNGAGLTIKARDDKSPAASLSGVTITNCNINNNTNDIGFGEPGKNNIGPSNITVNGSSLTGSATYAVWDQRGNTADMINAAGNWWGTVDASAISSRISGLIDYSPWLGSNYLNDSHSSPWTWYVNNSNSSTIQEGINASIAGDIINVTPGTYNENVNINKAVTLKSLDANNKAIITGTGTRTTIASSGITLQDIVYNLTGDTSTDGVILIDRGGTWPAYTIQYSNITLSGVEVTGGRRALYATVSNIAIDNCKFINQHRDALFFNAVSGTTTISNNYFSGADASKAIIFENFSSGDPSTSGTIIINGNNVEGKRNFMVYNQWQSITDKVSLQIENNTIAPYGTAISVYDPREYVPTFDPANFDKINSVRIRTNCFTLSGTQLGVESPAEIVERVSARRNWWGSTEGSKSAVTDGVISIPWCLDSNCSSISSIQVNSQDSIQTAIDTAEDGDTVKIAVQTIPDVINIDNDITIEFDEPPVIDSLEVNNSNLTIASDITLSSGINLNNGNIIVKSDNKIILDTTATNPIETSSAKIIGTVEIKPRDVGTGQIDILGLVIQPGADDLGKVSIIRVSGDDGTVSSGGNTGIDMKWQIDADSQPTNGRTVTFTWLPDFDNGVDPTSIIIYRNDGSGWVQYAGPLNASGNPRQVTVDISGFSTWTIGDSGSPFVVVNSAPVLASIEGSALSYSEGEPAKQITGTITVTDVDDTDMESAVIQITGNYISGEDVLNFTNQNGITGSWNSGTGTLTLNGSSSKANYQTALRDIKYSNNNSSPSTIPRTIQFTVNDGEDNSNTVARQINVASINNAPVLTSIEGAVLHYEENESVKAITSSIVISDADDVSMESAVINITGNYNSGEDLLIFEDQNGITGSWNSGTGTLTLSGSSSIVNYQTALRDVKYSNTSNNPDTLLRTISFAVNDGELNSNTLTRQIKIIPANNAPVLSSIEETILNFTEGESAKQITGLITLTDADDSTMESAVIQITGNYKNGEDLLSFTDQNGITGIWDGSTGSITLNGIALKANYQTALRDVKYSNTSINPDTSKRTISFIISDGNLNSTAVTRQVKVTSINSAPIIAAVEETHVGYTENEEPKQVTASLTVTDVDDSTMKSAVIQITGNYKPGEDLLSFTDQNGIAGNWDSGTGTLTLNGSSSKANYETALRNVKYSNISNNPATLQRTVQFTVNDGNDNSNTASRQINITAMNNSPVLASIEETTLDYTENEEAKTITSSLTITDVDDSTLNFAVIQITDNYQTDEDALSFTDQNGITGNWDSGTGTLTLNGSSSIVNYQTALRNVKYYNISSNPDTLMRTVSITVNDGDAYSNSHTRQVKIFSINNAPELASIEETTLNYTENDPAIQITNSITVSDADNINIEGAVVRIANNYQNHEDVLSFTNQNGITGNWDAVTGTMTLKGSTSIANYQTALRSVKYSNTSKNPNTAVRTLSIIVTDGETNSNAATREISITSIDDPPVISFQLRPADINEDESIIIPFSEIYLFISDPDNDISTLMISFEYTGENLRIKVFADTLLSIEPKSNWFGLDAITVIVSDGNSSTGASFAVNVLSVNDLPSFITLNPDTLTIKSGESIALDVFNIISDEETPDSLLVFEFFSGNDSLLYDYDSKKGVLNISAVKDYRGKTELRIIATDTDGGTADITIYINVEGKITGIEPLSGQIPKDYEIYQNYPNPFNPTTIIRYGLPEESMVAVKIFNVLGEEVHTLFGGIKKAGYYEESLNGSKLASGIYLYTISAESTVSNKKFLRVRKMLLIK